MDLVSGRIRARVRVGWAPRSLTPVSGTPYLLVANAGSDSVSVIDTRARAEAARIAVGREPGQIAVSADGALAVVCERGDGAVAILDLSGLAQGRTGSITVASRTRIGDHVQPRAAALCGDLALVAAARAQDLTVLALGDGHIEATVRLPTAAGPAGVAVTGDGQYALVTMERAGSLAVVDLLEWRLTRRIPVGAGPRGITIDPADQSVYCALAHTGSVAVVHLDGVDLSNTDGHPQYEAIRAGSRPSTVTIAQRHLPDL
ncbi:YncE family protein [Streptomyces sp. NPDC057939]|uniref:YncE family protein n=1 Tax=Streptomyces sp. NPDC057939 TaxID=3346284 RepID=UPI0036E4154C